MKKRKVRKVAPKSSKVHSEKRVKGGSKKKVYHIHKQLIFILAGLAIILYANTYDHEWAFDDFPTIYGNKLTMAGIDGIPTMLTTAYWFGLDGQNEWLYRPLSLIMFAIEWEFWPDNPTAGHIINILLYALGSVLMFLLVRLLLNKKNNLIPFISTIIFLIHPLHTEVVANIKSRDEIMSMIFAMTAIFMVIRFLDEKQIKYIIVAAASYFLALFSKESAITFLAVFPLSIYFFRDVKIKENIMASASMIAPAALYLIIRGTVLTSQTGTGEISLADNTLIGAPDYLTQLAMAFHILGLYIKNLVFPYPLASDYSYAHIPIVTFSNPLSLFALVFHLFIGVYALLKLKSKSYISYGILFYLITLSLVTNVIFLTKSTMADRFLYAPSFGFAIAMATLLTMLFKSDIITPNKNLSYLFNNNRSLFMLIAVLVLIGGWRTIDRNKDWKNDYSIFSADIKNSPNSARLHFLLANHLTQSLNQGIVPESKQEEYYQTALKEFKECIRLYPDYLEAYFGLGEAYTKRNNLGEAIKYYEIAVQKNPKFQSGLNNLGNAYFRAGKNDLAINSLNEAIELNPQYSEAHNNLGTVYFTLQKYTLAEKSYLKAIQYSPSYVDALKNLGSTYGTIQRFDDSIKYFLEALKYDPNNAEINYFLGLTYNSKGDTNNSNIYLQRAYQLDPSLKR